ncbi:hypothetical protein EV44_g3457 [Erysiphe necator]|uniref:Reverse transcriptase domain-containing protein n=1 Tax=Uncinula necator TaxID=52586 RepID=A0A0B1PAW2_UNCNE|nr:hypothetical protein EV44_g3457 [Erysiphe necator]
MAEHFFPSPIHAELEDIKGAIYPEISEPISNYIDEVEFEEAISKLPNDRAPGPDGIPNRLLKQCRKTLSIILKDLLLRYDTANAYKPIALLNTIGKLLEKLVANRISKAAEKYGLLLEEKMGVRAKSLDIFGAFDNVSHQRLVHNLREKGTPSWMITFIESFLKERSTVIVLGSFKGDQIQTSTGIPQGSSLSPILFLFFASTQLSTPQTATSSAVGFVDDTNILTWSDTTEENCLRLQQLHEKYESLDKTHGVKFAPNKYQLMHFSRARNKHNLQAPIIIQSHLTNPQISLRILGIHLDPKLNWGADIENVQWKTDLQMRALNRLAQSTWGATFHKTKLLYNTLVRPSLMYGSPIWAEAGLNGKIPERIVTGAYKSTSSRALEHETSTLPIEIYLKQRRVQFAGLLKRQPVQQTITAACEKITQRGIRRDNRRAKMKIEDIAEWEGFCDGIESQKAKNRLVKLRQIGNGQIPGQIKNECSALVTEHLQTLKYGKQLTSF